MQVKTGVKWMGDSFDKKLSSHRATSQHQAGKFYQSAVVADITRRQGSYSPDKHSLPGDPPMWITRKLARSYKIIFNRASRYLMLFSDLPYARYLEQGTRKMLPRPHLRANLIDFRDAIARIMCRRM